jgi:WD40 repeat protein
VQAPAPPPPGSSTPPVERLRLIHQAMVRGVVFSPDGTRLATANYGKIARIWAI